MSKIRNILFYVLTISGFGALMFFIIRHGGQMEAGKVEGAAVSLSNIHFFDQFLVTMHHNLHHPLSILLLQIITIVFVSRTFGYIFNKMGQPTVIGEIVAGIILGPSLLGMWFPEYSLFLFPKTSLPNLQFFSQMGLILFMFVIGMELDLKILKNKAQDAIVISHSSIIVPYTLGVLLSYFLYAEFAPKNISFLSFSLFIGISMSITAFPVLARIIQERGLTRTKLGTIAITCAAADDITAWCILAAVIAIVKAGSFMSSIFTILMALGYVVVMLKLIQPFLKRLGEVYYSKESLSLGIVALILGVLLISAFTTEVIGIHALFGAFMAGVVMPQSTSFRKILIEKVEYISLSLFLPLFFVFTGLRTQIGLLNDVHLWLVCGAVIGVAILGKFGGSSLAARFVGQSWKESLSIGALMNTRGLMELIVLNIGYDLGVLSAEMFAMLVLMALLTTFMTGPILDLINWAFKDKTSGAEDKSEDTNLSPRYKVLMSFGNPQSGKKMVRLAHAFTNKTLNNTDVTALHVSPSSDINLYEAAEFEKESFRPLKVEANKLRFPIRTIFKSSNDINSEILETVNKGQFDLMIIGVGQSIFEGTFLGKLVGFTAKALNPEKLISKLSGKETLLEKHKVLDERSLELINDSPIPVGVFIDKDFRSCDHVMIPIFGIGDFFMLLYAKQLIRNNNSTITLLDFGHVMQSHTEFKDEVNSLSNLLPNSVSIVDAAQYNFESITEADLIAISFEGWKKVIHSKDGWVSSIPSVLIIRP